MNYYPEGKCKLLNRKFESIEEAEEAMERSMILEGRVILCDSDHNLHLDIGAISGVIPRCEGAIGIAENTTRDIALISKVNKFVCYKIIGFSKDINGEKTAILSRRAVQEECMKNYISTLSQGDIIDAAVTHLERFGAFIDIGAGINALIPIDMLSVSRINHPKERLSQGQKIKTVLRKIEEQKLTFSLEREEDWSETDEADTDA